MPISNTYSTIFSKFLQFLQKPAQRQSTELRLKRSKSTSTPAPSSCSLEQYAIRLRKSKSSKHQSTRIADTELLTTLLELTPEDLVQVFQNLEPEEISKILRRIYEGSSLRIKEKS